MARAIRNAIRAESFATETPIFIARQADSHKSLEFPIRANHPIRANRANFRFARITPLSSPSKRPNSLTKLGLEISRLNCLCFVREDQWSGSYREAWQVLRRSPDLWCSAPFCEFWATFMIWEGNITNRNVHRLQAQQKATSHQSRIPDQPPRSAKRKVPWGPKAH